MTRRVRGKSPHPVDSHLGLRLRIRRKDQGLSLDALAAALGVAYQQVQKYETGANRISASTLYDIAAVLGAPIDYFYRGLPDPAGGAPEPQAIPRVDCLLATAGGGELVDAFLAMPPRLRRQFLALAQSVGEATSGEFGAPATH